MGSDKDLDETIEESFPASDAPANTVETGVRLAVTAIEANVFDNRKAGRLELTVDQQTAVLYYKREAQSLVLVHTEVPPAIRRRHLGTALVKAAIARARADGLQIAAVCPFAKAYLEKHPENR